MDEQELSSLTKALDDRALAERWLAESGIFPATMADNLYAWARMQPGIRQARLEVSVGVTTPKPYVKFILIPKFWFLYRLATFFKSRGGIIGKLGLLILIKLGTPMFAGDVLVALASQYLPGSYDVRYEYARE